MSSLEDFEDILQRDEPLAPYTWLKVGGSAEYLIEPRTTDEIIDVVRTCDERETPTRVLGGGSNLLIRDEGVTGVVIRLSDPSFARIEVDRTTLRAGSGASLSHIVSASAKAGLSGLESLAGIPGTVGGALRGNAGGRSGDIGQYVQSVNVVTVKGEKFVRTEEELSFGYRSSSINELVVLEGTFQLREDDPDEITKRIRKLWIMKKATQPLTYQSAGCIFKNSRGISAGTLIEQAGLKGKRVGGAEISARHANFVVTEKGTRAADVLNLIDHIKAAVSEQFGVDLELEIKIW